MKLMEFNQSRRQADSTTPFLSFKRRVSYSCAMALVALLLSFSIPALAQLNLPQPQGFVNDFAGKLSAGKITQLDSLLRAFRDRTGGIEIAIVTLPHEQLQGYTPHDYALALGRQWGLGGGTDKSAAVLLVAIKPPDANGLYSGNTWLEVSRHLEGDVPDALASEITRRMRDNTRAGRFDEAIDMGTQTLLATIAQSRGISIEGLNQSYAYRPAQNRQRRSSRISPLAILAIVFVVFMIISALGRRGGGGRGGGGRRRYSSDWMIWPIIFGGGGPGGFGGYRGGSDWGGSGGGGGFEGFGGGGDFGGGGAGDSW
jgi:uncharacterized protein